MAAPPPLPPRDGHSPRGTPNRSPSRPNPPRRGSSDTTMRARPSIIAGNGVAGRTPPPSAGGHGRTPPPLPGRSPSVFSGRESVVSRRGEAMSSPPPHELELFAHHCREFFFSLTPPEESSAYISTTLARLLPSHRAAYTRVQSRVRSEAHLYHLRVRISSFHALLAATAANGSLSLPSRQDPLGLAGTRARAERKERMAAFVQTWCAAGSGGLEPFFRGLWAVLRAQSRGGSNRGGAGAKRVVWEVDDAVFLESGGPEFMHEAITMMKGVLGFEDQPLSSPPKVRRSGQTSADRARSSSDPFTDKKTPGTASGSVSKRGPAPPPPPSRGTRRPSPTPLRPDANGIGSPTLPPPSPYSPGADTPVLSPTPDEHDRLLPSPNPANGSAQLSPLSPLGASHTDPSEDDLAMAEEADLNAPRFRLWIFPAHIADDECEALMALFPAFTKTRNGRRVDVRFPLQRPGRAKDLELGLGPGSAWTTVCVDGIDIPVPKTEAEDEAGVARFGTGRMWVSDDDRKDWEGGVWFRFLRWWRRLFGLG